MTRLKYVVRAILLFLIVLLLFQLNSKADENVKSIAEFKFEMFEKVRKDTLDSKHKLNMVLNETTKFVEGSSRVRNGIQRLMGLLALLVVSEVGFAIHEKRNSKQQGR